MRKSIQVTLFVTLFAIFVFGTAVYAQDTLDFTQDPTFGAFPLEAGFPVDPFIVTVISGGTVDVAGLELGENCTGFAAAAPDFRLGWGGDADNLRVLFVGLPTADEEEADSTLIINQPDGSWLCNDDSFDTLSPTVEIEEPIEGQYDIWVGSFSADSEITGYLIITEFPDTEPTSINSTGLAVAPAR